MYHIEELPNSKTAPTPGYSYVPDTGFDPAKAAITPALGRKRNVREPAGRGDLSARQQNAIVRHLAELDRENHRDVPIPIKPRDKGTKPKSTQNVRRILASQKTFKNYLDDEEAALSLQRQQQQQSTSHPSTSTTAASKGKSRRQSVPPATSRQKPSATPSESQPEPAPQSEPVLPKTPWDNDPLLRSYTPSAPSEAVMKALLAEPPLSYNEARAGPPTTAGTPRHFCAICGYWGKIRCKRCTTRTCGLDCYRVHEESRCGAFF